MAERPGGASRVETTPRRAHTESDIDIRGVAWFGVALILSVGAVALATHVTLSILDRRPAPGTAKRSPLAQERVVPEPRLQTSPPADLAAFRAHEDAILSSSGWVDQSAGIARIPIEVAKQRVLETGFPVATRPVPADARSEKNP